MQYKYYFEKRSRGETEMITDNKGVAREIPPPCLIIINDQVMPNGYDINMIPASSIKSIGVISGSRMLIVGTDYSTFGQTRGVNLDMIPRKALVITTKYGEKIKKTTHHYLIVCYPVTKKRKRFMHLNIYPRIRPDNLIYVQRSIGNLLFLSGKT